MAIRAGAGAGAGAGGRAGRAGGRVIVMSGAEDWNRDATKHVNIVLKTTPYPDYSTGYLRLFQDEFRVAIQEALSRHLHREAQKLLADFSHQMLEEHAVEERAIFYHFYARFLGCFHARAAWLPEELRCAKAQFAIAKAEMTRPIPKEWNVSKEWL